MYFHVNVFVMVTFLIVGGILLMLAGIAGCFLPILPGPVLCYVALLIQQFGEAPPFTTRFLVMWGILTVVVSVLDYVIPIYSTKKVGGSKLGTWGCTIGLFAGLWLGPLGIIVGPFLGAFVGELLASQNTRIALRSAVGSFVGFLLGTVLKLVVCLSMGWYFARFVYTLTTV